MVELHLDHGPRRLYAFLEGRNGITGHHPHQLLLSCLDAVHDKIESHGTGGLGEKLPERVVLDHAQAGTLQHFIIVGGGNGSLPGDPDGQALYAAAVPGKEMGFNDARRNAHVRLGHVPVDDEGDPASGRAQVFQSLRIPGVMVDKPEAGDQIGAELAGHLLPGVGPMGPRGHEHVISSGPMPPA